MANLLIIDGEGTGVALAFRASQRGHKVRLFIEPSPQSNPNIGAGFEGITKVQNWVGSTRWADVIFVCDNNKYLPKLDALKRAGVPIFAPSKKSADLEIKRGLGMDFLKSHKIDVPEFQIFKSLKEAEKHVWKTNEAFVFKTLGDNEDKSLSYVGKTPADLIARLQMWQQTGMNPKGDVMLQKLVKGVEFSITGVMGKNGWLNTKVETFEYKKLMPGNYGPNTGEMGTVAKSVNTSKIFDMMLKPLEEDLLKLGHVGFCDMNTIIDESGKIWPLEFTNRPGWPIYNLILAGMKNDPVEWMIDALEGKDTLDVKKEVGICVVIAQPNFPYIIEGSEPAPDNPIYGLNSTNIKHIQPQFVQIKKFPDMDGDKVKIKPMWSTAGEYLAVVTGFGDTVPQASRRVYKTVDQLSVSNMIVRNDIGKTLNEKQLPELQKLGFAADWNLDKGNK
jgi:phosphoribosylamine--glycine ligase